MDKKELLSIVILACLFFIICLLSLKLRKYKKSIRLFYSILDHNEEIDIKKMIEENHKLMKVLKTGMITEYEKKKKQININHNKELKKLNKKYYIKIKELKKESKKNIKIASKSGSIKDLKKEKKTAKNRESSLLKEIDGEIKSLSTKKKEELEQLDNDYKPTREYHKHLDIYVHDLKVLDKHIDKAKKNEYIIPKLKEEVEVNTM